MSSVGYTHLSQPVLVCKDLATAPQSTSFLIDRNFVFIMSMPYLAVRQVDGVIYLSTPELDGKALTAIQKVMGYPVFGIG